MHLGGVIINSNKNVKQAAEIPLLWLISKKALAATRVFRLSLYIHMGHCWVNMPTAHSSNAKKLYP